MSGGRRRYCPDLGIADPVFETGAASLYLPAFQSIYDLRFTIDAMRLALELQRARKS
jgi:hypothetical protein